MSYPLITFRSFTLWLFCFWLLRIFDIFKVRVRGLVHTGLKLRKIQNQNVGFVPENLFPPIKRLASFKTWPQTHAFDEAVI